MGGKFRVKAEAAPDRTRRQFCAGTGVESMKRPRFHHSGKRSSPRKTFLLGRSVVITDNEP
jgi:hypothetical protein